MKELATYIESGEFLGELPFEKKLVAVHVKVHDCIGLRSIGRISVATLDKDTGLLSVYAYSDLKGSPLPLYSAPLAEVPSLQALAQTGQIRVIPDLFAFGPDAHAHTVAVRQNYRSSLTIPIRRGSSCYGFIFFNSDEAGYFGDAIVERILPYGNLLAAITIGDLDRYNTVQAAVRTAQEIGNLRDDETAGHLHRMAEYARLIAIALAPRYKLSERWIDMLTHFAPLHDVGKIGIPDNILFKPGKLSPDELQVMRTHVAIGAHIVEMLLSNFRISDQMFGSLLMNVVACHHETLDGQGYPNGLAGDAIPLEARIVSVADIFDALTSKRPYKKAWSNEEAFAHLDALAGTKLDAFCVSALIDHPAQIAQIQEHYRAGLELPVRESQPSEPVTEEDLGQVAWQGAANPAAA